MADTTPVICARLRAARATTNPSRDKIYGDVGGLTKQPQPSETLFSLARAMFRDAWTAHCEQAQQIIRSDKLKQGEFEKQIETLLMRIPRCPTPG